jgi:thymidine phosphorylase
MSDEPRQTRRVPATTLRLRRLGIDSYRHAIVYMHVDCPVCRSEGFSVQSRVQLSLRERTVVASLQMVTGDLLQIDDAGLSDIAWQALGAKADDVVAIDHPPPLESLSHVRAKVYGGRLDDQALRAIIGDIVAGRYSDVHLAAFVTACAGERLDGDEILSLTRAMAAAGERLAWANHPIMDKHSVGGLPGNRTTPIVVAIVAAAGLTIPKTSSRAITSPAGTADAMETLAPVNLSTALMRRVVEREGGCIVWGGAVNLSPADDVLIGVERPLDLDSEGQLVASVLSKKLAAGSTHVVIDIPVGLTAKVRSPESASALSARLVEIGHAVGISVDVMVGDGTQPIGRGIGPSLEALDVVAVLENRTDAPRALRERALALAGRVIELGQGRPAGAGLPAARRLLEEGSAWRKFEAICNAQGGLREPPRAPHRRPVLAQREGFVNAIDNRRLARAAKLAGAPASPSAGIEFLAPLGTQVAAGQPLFVVHAAAPGEMDYAFAYLAQQPEIVKVADVP